MSTDEGKKYTLKLEAEAASFRDLLSLLIEIVGEVHDSEEVIKESGFIMTGKSATSKYHYDIEATPWEAK